MSAVAREHLDLVDAAGTNATGGVGDMDSHPPADPTADMHDEELEEEEQDEEIYGESRYMTACRAVARVRGCGRRDSFACGRTSTSSSMVEVVPCPIN